MNACRASSSRLIARCCAVAVGVGALCSGADAYWGFHISGPTGGGGTWGVWITSRAASAGNHSEWSTVNTGGTAGTLTYAATDVGGPMGLMYPLPGGGQADANQVSMVMGGLDVGGFGGSSPVDFACWGLWIVWGPQGSPSNIHLSLPAPPTALARTGTSPEGYLEYGASGLHVPFVFEDGQTLFAEHISFSADALPAPGAAALLGLGGVMAARRRRA
jgi:hypothetical protein